MECDGAHGATGLERVDDVGVLVGGEDSPALEGI